MLVVHNDPVSIAKFIRNLPGKSQLILVEAIDGSCTAQSSRTISRAQIFSSMRVWGPNCTGLSTYPPPRGVRSESHPLLSTDIWIDGSKSREETFARITATFD